MIDPQQLDHAYSEFSKNLQKWAPDGIIHVNLQTLDQLGLLNLEQLNHSTSDEITHYFHVIETADRVTLCNDQFVVWIVPQNSEENFSTITYIALMQAETPHLEIVFTTSGVYNTPKYILKILEHFLSEVIDTEEIISSIGRKES